MQSAHRGNKLEIFGSPNWTVFPSTILSDGDFRLLPWKPTWNIWDSRETLCESHGNSRQSLFEILAVVNILSLISSVRGEYRAESSLWRISITMGWLQSVGSIKFQVSFSEYSLFYRALLKKGPEILSILLTNATPLAESQLVIDFTTQNDLLS